jgi:ubiquitin C-terminal hydrolase
MKPLKKVEKEIWKEVCEAYSNEWNDTIKQEYKSKIFTASYKQQHRLGMDYESCSKQKCNENPNCLIHLQPKMISIQSIQEKNVYGCGIKNRGATCYVNSLLQV